MNRKLSAYTIAAILVTSLTGSPLAAQIDVHIGIPLPRIVFEREPEVVAIPNTDVYYAPSVGEYDTYRVGSFWYINRDGDWYRARGYRGRFQPVPYGRIPRQIVGVSEEYRHHRLRREPREFHDRGDGHHNRDRHERGDSRHRGKHNQHKR